MQDSRGPGRRGMLTDSLRNFCSAPGPPQGCGFPGIRSAWPLVYTAPGFTAPVQLLRPASYQPESSYLGKLPLSDRPELQMEEFSQFADEVFQIQLI